MDAKNASIMINLGTSFPVYTAASFKGIVVCNIFIIEKTI